MDHDIELRFVYNLADGEQGVQTGYWVRDTMTLAQVRELALKLADRGEDVPDIIEFDVRGADHGE